MSGLAAWRAGGDNFDFGGHRVFYRHARREVATPRALVCIHGFPTASWDWHRIWDRLCAAFDIVVAPDMLGFGYSAKPRGHRYRIAEQCDLHEQLAAHLGISEAVLLAHDYGDTVAQEWLARALDGSARVRPQAVALLNGGLFPETHRPRPVQRMLASPLGPLLARAMRRSSFERSFRAIFGTDTQPSDAELADFWALLARDRGTVAMARLIHYMAERRQWRARWVDALVRSPVPLRLINGLVDPVSGAHMVERYRTLVPRPDVVALDGIGHYPQIEAPDAVADAFLEWPALRAPADR